MNWHAPCKSSGIADGMVPTTIITGRMIMFARFDVAPRVASLVATLVVAAALFTAAVPVLPVA
jgi:hypothetical protein